MPLRLFMGVTFVFAGLQKLANPNFFNARSPISIQASLVASAHTSPLHALLRHLEGVATPMGLLIAFSELAVGVGTLLGLYTRVAALGGLVLSLTLFLTVSFHSSPYFTGADIVFFFAWTPFIVAGGGSRLSLDAWMADRVAARSGHSSLALVPIPFATVQSLCGNYDEGRCRARADRICDAAACPVLLAVPAARRTEKVLDGVDRRSLIVGGTATAVAILGAAVAEVGRAVGGATAPTSNTGTSLNDASSSSTTTPATVTSGAPTTTTPTSTGPTAKGTLLGPARDVPTNRAASFVIPSNNDPGIVIHTEHGDFVAYDAVCPHAGCTVGYSSTSKIIVCPCHGSEFEVSNGDVIVGPAPHGLTKLTVVEGSNGNLYLQ